MSFKHFIKVLIGIVALSWVAGCNAIEFNGLHINGFLSQGYLHTNHNDYLADTKGGTFDFNEVGLNLGYQFNDSLRFGAQILSRNLGVDGNNKFTFGYLFGDYNFNRYIGLRGGKIRIPMGLYNQSRDVDMLRTTVFLPNAVYHDEYYIFFSSYYGISIYGEFPLGVIGTLEYELFGGTPDEDDESRLMKNTKIMMQNGFGSDVSYMGMSSSDCFGGALRWNTLLNGLRFGYSSFFYDTIMSYEMLGIGTLAIDAKLEPLHVLSAEYVWRDLTVSYEWMRMRRFNDFLVEGTLVNTENAITDAWYLNTSYKFNELFEFGAGYSEHYDNKNNREGDGYAWDHKAWRKDLTLFARFDITDNWLVKVEYHIMDGTAWLPNSGLYSDANSSDNIKQKWNMIALKTTFSF